MPTAPPSLRERRRSETWTAVHDAAASLALEAGLEHATVEAIASKANVSPRTFFNYFPSKEHAVLGIRPPSLDGIDIPEAIEGDTLEEVSRLLVAVLRSSFGNDSAYDFRQQLTKRFPQLIQRRMETMAEVEALVGGVVEGWLRADRRTAAGAAGFNADEAARMLVMLAAVPVRFTFHSPSVKHGASGKPGEADELTDFRPALGLFRQILELVE